MVIRKSKASEDGLDAVLAAYHALRRTFEAAEVTEVPISEDDVDVMLKLPGTGEIVDPNDLNALNGLERYIIDEFKKRLKEGEIT